MATLPDTVERLRTILRYQALSIDGDPRIEPDSFDFQIPLRNRYGVRIVLHLTQELVEDAKDGVAVVDVVERSKALAILATTESSRTLGVRRNGQLFERD